MAAGRRLGGRVALGGGGPRHRRPDHLLAAVQLLGGGLGGGGGAAGCRSRRAGRASSRGRPRTPRRPPRPARPGRRRTPSSTARSSPSSTRWTATGRRVRPFRPDLPAAAHQLLLRRREHRLRQRQLGHRAVLLPGRHRDLHRPVVLPGAGDPVRRAGRAVLPGLRDRARVRPPHPEPAGHQPAGCSPATPARPPARCGWSCRPTATPASGPTTPRRRPTASGRAADHRRHPGGRDRRAGHRVRGSATTSSRPNLGGGRVDESAVHATAAPRSASAGARPASRPATRRAATRSPAASTWADHGRRSHRGGRGHPAPSSPATRPPRSHVQSGRTEVRPVEEQPRRPRRAGPAAHEGRRMPSRPVAQPRRHPQRGQVVHERRRARPAGAEVVERELQHGGAHLGADPAAAGAPFPARSRSRPRG